MKILITGGSGFLGTNLVSDLIEQGHKVTIFDKRRSEKYPELCIIADIRDRDKLCTSMRGADAVYHLAAEHADKIQPTSLYYDVNLEGGKNIVYGLERNGIEKLIFTSTVAVYGISSEQRTEESPIKPFNDYGKSKYQSELIFNEWAGTNSRRCLITVRPTVIFGERNRGNVYRLFNQIKAGKFMMVGNGKNKKSIAYVRNVSKFMTILLNSASRPGSYVCNYADKPDLTTEELVKIAMNTLGVNQRVNFRIPMFLGFFLGYGFDLLSTITRKNYPISSVRIKKFCSNSVINAEKLNDFGFEATYSLEDAINRTILYDFS
jgi:nucleoside-diphosphate-sugar epimerase